MVKYSKVNVKLSNSQLNKLETAAKNQTRVTLRMNIKMFNGNNLPHELLLTTRQKTKLRNAFENNMSTDIKLSKAQISKIIQSGGFLGSLLSKIAGPVMKVAVPLAKHVLALLGISAAASAIDARIEKKIHGSHYITCVRTRVFTDPYSIYGRMRVSKNPYSPIFNAVYRINTLIISNE